MLYHVAFVKPEASHDRGLADLASRGRARDAVFAVDISVDIGLSAAAADTTSRLWIAA